MISDRTFSVADKFIKSFDALVKFVIDVAPRKVLDFSCSWAICIIYKFKELLYISIYYFDFDQNKSSMCAVAKFVRMPTICSQQSHAEGEQHSF